jgi:hypothetical protein
MITSQGQMVAKCKTTLLLYVCHRIRAGVPVLAWDVKRADGKCQATLPLVGCRQVPYIVINKYVMKYRLCSYVIIWRDTPFWSWKWASQHVIGPCSLTLPHGQLSLRWCISDPNWNEHRYSMVLIVQWIFVCVREQGWGRWCHLPSWWDASAHGGLVWGV